MATLGCEYGDMTNTTEQYSPLGSAEDPRAWFAGAVVTASGLLGAITEADQTKPSPCDDLTVAGLGQHLVGVLDRVGALGRGEDPMAVPEPTVEAHQYQAAFLASAHQAQTAWTDPAVLDRTMSLPWITAPGRDVLGTYLCEVILHSWDLARALGSTDAAWDDQAIGFALDSMRPILPPEGRTAMFEEMGRQMGGVFPAPFAEAVKVPADAPLIDQLVAYSGRQP
jgi:uncharacterized protein (TIGR03086 family)